MTKTKKRIGARKVSPPRRRKNGKRKGPLAPWVAKSGKSLTTIAAVLECSVQHLSNLLHGHTDPSRDLAVRIETMTDGSVPVGAWS